MFSIEDGKTKFFYNYKAAESVIFTPKKYRYPNYLTSYNKKMYDNPGSNFNFKLDKFNLEKEKHSKYFIDKNKELKKLKEQIKKKKVDILLNKALEKSNTIRNYSFKINNNDKILRVKNFNKTNYIFPDIYLEHKSLALPSFSQDIIKKNIISTVNNFFPERYFNKKDKKKYQKKDWAKALEKQKQFDEYKKIYRIKYINCENDIQDDKKLKVKKKESKAISPAITILNKNNKNQIFLTTNDIDRKDKKIDVGLNTISFNF